MEGTDEDGQGGTENQTGKSETEGKQHSKKSKKKEKGSRSGLESSSPQGLQAGEGNIRFQHSVCYWRT